MKKILLMAIFTLFPILPVFAVLEATVDRKEVYAGESFQLTIHAGHIDDSQVPDINPLKKDFEILSTGQSSQVIIANGKSFTDSLWVFVLSPKQVGHLTIPSISIGHDSSNPINMTSKNARDRNPIQSPQADNRHVFMEASLSPNKPFVQSQAMYTLKIYYDRRIENPQLSEPSSDNASFIHLGNDTNYETTLEGKPYEVMELHFAMFPQKSGILSIKSPLFSGNVMSPRAGQYFSNLWQPFKISAPPMTADIAAMPKDANTSWWLPSKQLKLEETWSQDLNQVEAGMPLTRTITVTAQGILANQLPSLMPKALAHFQIYPDKPSMSNKTDGEHIYATRTEKAAFIADKAGDYTIPAVTLHWWDTDSWQAKTATLPAQKIQVIPAVTTNQETLNTKPVISPIQLQNNNDQSISAVTSVKTSSSQSAPLWRNLWFWLSSILLFSWFLLLSYFLLHKVKRRKKAFLKKNHLQEHEQYRLKQLKATAKEAAFSNDLKGFSQALIALANAAWPHKCFLVLGDIAEQITDEKTKVILKKLDAALYTHSENTWQGQTIWLSIKDIFIPEKNHKKEPLLPPLY